MREHRIRTIRPAFWLTQRVAKLPLATRFIASAWAPTFTVISRADAGRLKARVRAATAQPEARRDEEWVIDGER